MKKVKKKIKKKRGGFSITKAYHNYIQAPFKSIKALKGIPVNYYGSKYVGGPIRKGIMKLNRLPLNYLNSLFEKKKDVEQKKS